MALSAVSQSYLKSQNSFIVLCSRKNVPAEKWLCVSKIKLDDNSVTDAKHHHSFDDKNILVMNREEDWFMSWLTS